MPDDYKEGREAYARGEHLNESPYPKGHPGYWGWMAGWSDAAIAAHRLLDEERRQRDAEA